MTALISTYNNTMEKVDLASNWLTPTLARLVFIAVLLVYYWNSAMTEDRRFDLFAFRGCVWSDFSQSGRSGPV